MERTGTFVTLFLALLSVPAVGRAEAVALYAAGSLKAALAEVAAAYGKTTGNEVETTFGPSGLLRERIEKGEAAQVFASANMEHPRALESQGRGSPVVLFARNRLCAIAQGGLEVSSASLLDVLLAPGTRLGTSTPKADPSGDYAWELFGRAEKARPGSFEVLSGKALQLTGGPDSEKAPAGRNQYGWVMESKKADVFLTYCTNAVLARTEVPDLQVVQIPPELAVGADYGLVVLNGAPVEAWRLALFIVSPVGQEILGRFGFVADAVPAP
jgi:ABC-type molybdate transport system substrate-binding protein